MCPLLKEMEMATAVLTEIWMATSTLKSMGMATTRSKEMWMPVPLYMISLYLSISLYGCIYTHREKERVVSSSYRDGNGHLSLNINRDGHLHLQHLGMATSTRKEMGKPTPLSTTYLFSIHIYIYALRDRESVCVLSEGMGMPLSSLQQMVMATFTLKEMGRTKM